MKKDDLKNVDWNEILLGEMLLLGVLSKAIQSYPEREWLQQLLDEDFFSESPLGNEHADIQAGLSLLRTWRKENQKGIADEHLSDLEADYTRLFIGVGEVLAPPWESVYFTKARLVFQQETLQVRIWYRRFGLESEKLHKEPDDHIGLEMSFVAYLTKLALQAYDDKDEKQFKQLIADQRQFLSEHLLTWGPHWCDQVIEHAHTDFYKGLALLTKGALLTLAEQFDIKVSKEVVR